MFLINREIKKIVALALVISGQNSLFPKTHKKGDNKIRIIIND